MHIFEKRLEGIIIYEILIRLTFIKNNNSRYDNPGKKGTFFDLVF